MFSRKRNIVLLLDDFSVHEAAVRELGGERRIFNVRIIWLPKDTISHY